jgi:hypothetical protein
MTSTYTANNGIEKIETGDQSGTWGETTNTNFDIIDRALNGVGSITLSGTSHTLTTTDGSLTDGMFKVLSLAGSPTGTNTITISPNDQDKLYFVKNASGQSVVFSQGTGANVTIPNGGADIIFADGAGSGAAVSSLFASAIQGYSVTFGGRVLCDDTTDATSTTDGSVQTDGGLSVAKDAIFGNDVTLKSDDAVLGFGADTDVTITHDPDDGLFFKSTATGDDNPFVLTIQTGETDIAADDKLGVINFQAPDEGTGTDAILVAAGIEAVSEGDFAADSNATSLAFKTASSEAAAEKLRIDSIGQVMLSGSTTAFDTTPAKNGLQLYYESDSGLGTIGTRSDGGATSLVFQTNTGGGASSEAVRIDSSGNVGIGATSPSSRLSLGDSTVSSSNTITFGKRVTSSQSNLPLIGHDSSDGSASDLGICATSSSGKINFYTGNDAAGFGNGSNELRMTIDSTGAVGIGAEPSGGTALDVRNDGVIQIINTDQIQLIASNGGSTLKNVSNNVFLFGTNNTERMRLTAGGDLLINTTSQVGSGNPRVSVDNGSDGVCIATSRSGTSSVAHMQFINGSGTVGSISTSGSATAFNTSSDYRLKTSVESMTDATARLKQLNPVRFKFLADTSTTLDGFLAHEVQAIIPEAVTGTKDEVDADGNAVMQGIDQSKIVPLLVATIKELEARIAALES